MQRQMTVLPSTVHILKFEPYREGYHGPEQRQVTGFLLALLSVMKFCQVLLFYLMIQDVMARIHALTDNGDCRMAKIHTYGLRL